MKPMIFNTEMTRAIQNDKKTVTRRVLRTKKYIPDNAEFGYTAYTPEGHISCRGTFIDEIGNKRYGESFMKLPCQIGDILYVRETWRPFSAWSGHPKSGCEIEYKAGGRLILDKVIALPTTKREWKPSIHMPKEAARIFLRVTEVRIERLNEITIDDIQKEGIKRKNIYPYGCSCIWKTDNCMNEPCTNRDNYEYLCWTEPFSQIWDNTIKSADRTLYGWDANPWVWVIEFERISKEKAICLTKQS